MTRRGGATVRSVPVGYRTLVPDLLRHPSSWVAACRQARRLAPRGWWRRPPFLPLPDRRWIAFRTQTMYGDGAVDPADVRRWLDWVARYEGR